MKMNCLCTHPQAKSAGLMVLRLTLAAVFIHHGWLKLSDITSTAGFFQMIHIPFAMGFAWLVGLVEFIGGLMLLLGAYTRTAAMVLVVNMIVALLVVHLGKPFGGAELALVCLGGSAVLATSGAGHWRAIKAQCACGASDGCAGCEAGKQHKH